MYLLLRFIVNAVILWLVICLVPGFHNNAGESGFGAYSLGTIVILAIIFGLVNMLIGPILRLISAPITWLTHGLFQIIINWALLALSVWIAPNVRGNWLATLIGAIVITLIGTFLTMAWNPRSHVTTA
jgi:putative membrane protein